MGGLHTHSAQESAAIRGRLGDVLMEPGYRLGYCSAQRGKLQKTGSGMLQRKNKDRSYKTWLLWCFSCEPPIQVIQPLLHPFC